MPTTGRCARDNRKSDTNSEAPSNLEDATESHRARRGCSIQVGRCDRSNTGENVEEDAGGFGHAFSEDPRTPVLKVDFALGDRWSLDDVTRYVTLESFGIAYLDIAGVLADEVIRGCHGCRLVVFPLFESGLRIVFTSATELQRRMKGGEGKSEAKDTVRPGVRGRTTRDNICSTGARRTYQALDKTWR